MPFTKAAEKPIVRFDSSATTTYNSKTIPTTSLFAQMGESSGLASAYATSATPTAVECSFKGGCLLDIPSVGLSSSLSVNQE